MVHGKVGFLARAVREKLRSYRAIDNTDPTLSFGSVQAAHNQAWRLSYRKPTGNKRSSGYQQW